MLRVGNLPLDFGEIQAKKAMKPLNNTIHDILYGDQEKLDFYHFNEHFVKSVKDREKTKIYRNQQFKSIILLILIKCIKQDINNSFIHFFL